ncbi:MAG: cobalamin B12-binding domain-containing protein [Deltaproteobacteria bacterium]|nr:cobalamin B12-binding domain-containing protein [Deltaproteobacteria bacterium]
MVGTRPIRVLLAKPGLDGHDLGVKMVALALKDAGMEVIYLGMRQTPNSIVKAAVQEDADVIGLSNLSASLIPMGRHVMELLKEKQMNIPVLYGGTILKEDRKKLLDIGIKETFSPGTMMKDIIYAIKKLVPEDKLR